MFCFSYTSLPFIILKAVLVLVAVIVVIVMQCGDKCCVKDGKDHYFIKIDMDNFLHSGWNKWIIHIFTVSTVQILIDLNCVQNYQMRLNIHAVIYEYEYTRIYIFMYIDVT